MSNWKPSNGLVRAEPIVRRLIEDSATANLEIRDPVFAHHVTTVLAQAIDQALTDGSEMDALASVVGNGHAHEGENPTGTWTAPAFKDGDTVAVTGGPHAGEYTVHEVKASPKKKRGRPPGRPKKAKAAEAAP